MTFNRIHIIGASGSGKTYLGQKLSQLLHLPLQDLDGIKWDNQGTYGVERPETERDRLLQEFITQPAWITEGIYYGWVGDSFAAADVIIILQPSAMTRNYRMILRFLKRKLGFLPSKNETIKDLIALIKWTNDYARRKIPEIIAMTDLYDDKRYYFNNADDALKFLTTKH